MSSENMRREYRIRNSEREEMRIGIRGVMNIERRLRWNIENANTETKYRSAMIYYDYILIINEKRAIREKEYGMSK